jgi:hypothetical protein
MDINRHTNLNKPFWAIITEIEGLIHYGEIKEGNIARSIYKIYTFNTKEEMIMFVIDNGGTYID